MVREEHRKQRLMAQFDPDIPLEEQVRILTEEYRNLFDYVENLAELIYNHDNIING